MSKCKQSLAVEAKWCHRFSSMWSWSIRWGLCSCKLPAVSWCRRATFLGFVVFCSLVSAGLRGDREERNVEVLMNGFYYAIADSFFVDILSDNLKKSCLSEMMVNALTMHLLHHKVFQTYFRLVWFCFWVLFFVRNSSFRGTSCCVAAVSNSLSIVHEEPSPPCPVQGCSLGDNS